MSKRWGVKEDHSIQKKQHLQKTQPSESKQQFRGSVKSSFLAHDGVNAE